MQNDLVKRLMWSGLLAGVGALATIVANRVATAIWVRVFNEDPPDRLMAADRAEPPPRSSAGGRSRRRESPLAWRPSRDAFAERPEAFVGAAFVGGFVFALILRRLTG